MAKLNKSMPMENSRWIRGDQIGKGSFGTVSLGFDRRNGRVFAVKSVPMSFSTAAQSEAIENEISVLRSLSSPFVVQYLSDDSTSASEIVYRNLHMEYVSGGTAAGLAKSGADEELLLRRVTWCLVSALKYVHSRGIVHCDVKGKNVLLGPTPGTAKLADFGSAKVAGDDRRERIVPRGSPLWMAPEVVRGESQGFESDVWALGCTLIEMVTGAPAWRDEGAKTLCRIGYSDELPRFPTRLSGVGIDFLEKCLRRDPSLRWSCDQLLQHPFLHLESTVQIEDSSSPRSVIEWPRLEVSDDENEDELAWGSDAGSRVDSQASSAAGDRIGKLAGLAGANWESEGWVKVRCVPVAVVVEEVSYAGFSGNEEAGTSLSFSGSWGAIQQVCPSTPTISGGGGCLGGGYGDGSLAAAVERREISFTAVKTLVSGVSGELLCLLLSMLCYSNHLCYCNNSMRNMPFFICYILFQRFINNITSSHEFTLLQYFFYYLTQVTIRLPINVTYIIHWRTVFFCFG